MTISSCTRASTVCPLRVWKTTLLKSLQDPKMVRKSWLDLDWFVGSVEPLARWPDESCICQTSQNLKDTNWFWCSLRRRDTRKMLWTDDLLRIRRYEAISRRPGQTLQDFFATENMAFADAVKAGVGIDPDKRAYHMFIKSGLTDDQINHIHGFVYDSEAQGPGSAPDPRKNQEAVLWFYDKPWDVDRHRDSRASIVPVLKTSDGTCGNDAPSSDLVSSPVQGWHKGQLRTRALGRRNLSDWRWLRVQWLERIHVATTPSRRVWRLRRGCWSGNLPGWRVWLDSSGCVGRGCSWFIRGRRVYFW